MENQPVQLLLLNPSNPRRKPAVRNRSPMNKMPRLIAKPAPTLIRVRPARMNEADAPKLIGVRSNVRRKKKPKKAEATPMAKKRMRRNPPKHGRHRRNEDAPTKKRAPMSAERKAAAAAKRKASGAAKQEALFSALRSAGLDPAALGLVKKPKRSKEEVAAAKASRAAAKQMAREAVELRKSIRALQRAGQKLTEEQLELIKPKRSGKPRKVRAGTAAAAKRARKEAAMELLATGAFSADPASVAEMVISGVRKSGKNKGAAFSSRIPGAYETAARALSRTKHKPAKAIASAWRAARKAQKLADTAEDRLVLRAMGLAQVPNPGVGMLMKDLGTLLPQMGVSAAALAGSAWIGQMAADKLVPDTQKDKFFGKAAPSVVSAAIGVAGYMFARRSKAMAKFAPAILFGGVAAAAIHAIARINVSKEGGGTQSIGQKLGLPIGIGEYAAMAGMGEYAAMAGMGEYAAMAGGTTYAGERGIFSGLDDIDPVLAGTDDEDEIDYTETLADEGVNADEGSLNGNIFD